MPEPTMKDHRSTAERAVTREDTPAEDRRSSSAAMWLLLYSAAMFTLPFAAFYGTRYALAHYLHVDGFPNTCGSVVAAVLVVNVIIFLYAVRGYEDAKDDDNRKPDSNENDGEEEEEENETKKSK